MSIEAYNSGANPVHSGLYIVQRGEKLGTPLRWYNAEKDTWSRCEYDMADALKAKDTTSALGFLPWRGPVKVVDSAKAENTVALVCEQVDVLPVVKVSKVAAKAKAPKAVKVAKPTKTVSAKVVHPDGTVFFREDRQKWVAVWNGKQEAARPTAEACLSFLKKKYNFDGKVVK